MSNKLRRVLAVIGLVFMAIFSVSFVIVLADRTLFNGAFGYVALISGLLGVAMFLAVKFLVKEEGTPAYLPKPDDDAPETESETADGQDEQPAVEDEPKNEQ